MASVDSQRTSARVHLLMNHRGEVAMKRLPRRELLRQAAVRAAEIALAAGAGRLTILRSPGWASAEAAVPRQQTFAVADSRMVPVRFRVNGTDQALDLDPRTTLLDALREHLHLAGTKKGCDHGQCGACTVLINGRRINSCLTLAVMHADDDIVTIEGLGLPGALHPLQAAFVERDSFQCGYCTPGQICSAVGMLAEANAGWPSHATADVASPEIALTDTEIRERMSGNICRCAAYPNIIAAIRDVAEGTRR